MSQRPGFVSDHRVSAEGRWPLTKSPNSQPDVISVQVRCHWPYTAPIEEVRQALMEGYEKAVVEVEARFLSDTRRWAQDQAIDAAPEARRWEDVKAERRARDDDYSPEAINRTADE